MAGLYVHIPFCEQKCYYCDFFSGNQFYLIDSYVDSLVREIELRSSYLEERKVKTIYFGGGTPSLLSVSHFSKLMEVIHEKLNLTADPEITVECNPEDVSIDYISGLFRLGINRISLGAQFFDDYVLAKYNRNHTKQQIIKSLDILSKSNFKNLSVDIIYAVPEISNENLYSFLRSLMQYKISHISAYSLTISKNSRLFWKTIKGEFVENKEDNSVFQYYFIKDFLKSNGYSQYEISNYAKEGFISEHNLSYWNQIPYLGVGVAAHSYNLISRRWNLYNTKKYLREIRFDIVDHKEEQLSYIQIYNEYIILKLRTFLGLSDSYIKFNFSKEIYKHFSSNMDLLKKKNHFYVVNDLIIPKESDLLLADYLAKQLIY